MDAQLREAKADRKESERDRRTTEAVEQLKRFFPGDLCLLWATPIMCLIVVSSAVQIMLATLDGDALPWQIHTGVLVPKRVPVNLDI